MYDFLNSTSTADHDYAAKPYALAEWGIHGATSTTPASPDYSDQARVAVEGNVFPNIKAFMVFDNKGPEGTENRVGYQNGGVPDPVRQEHYNAFANSSAFVDQLPDTTAPTAVITAPSEQRRRAQLLGEHAGRRTLDPDARHALPALDPGRRRPADGVLAMFVPPSATDRQVEQIAAIVQDARFVEG